jgi:hypothetical protein
MVALALAALLLAPLPARAVDGTDPPSDSSLVGVVFAVVCGASISITRMLPVPVVVATGAFACLGMLVDAMVSPDHP